MMQMNRYAWLCFSALLVAGCPDPERAPDGPDQTKTPDQAQEMNAPDLDQEMTSDMAKQLTLSLMPSELEVELGARAQFIAKVTDEDGQAIDRVILWTVTDPIAIIGSDGVIIPRREGRSEVIARTGELMARAQLVVSAPQLATLEITPGLTLLRKDETLQLTATGYSRLDNALDPQPAVTWSSSDERVLSVNGSGLVTAKAQGEGVITARAGDISAQLGISVSDAEIGSVSVTPMSLVLIKGERAALMAQVLDPQGDPIQGLTPQFVSDAPSIARVDAQGQVTAVGEGQAQITVSAGQAQATVRVTVSFDLDVLDAGAAHVCGLILGRAHCWGANDVGQLGLGTTSAFEAPIALPSTLRFNTISAGGQHTCAITTAGDAYCWGANDKGQLGTGDTVGPLNQPTKVQGSLKFTAISAGRAHTCAISTAKEVYCWGANDKGQLGTGALVELHAPAKVRSLSDIAQITAGGAHSCAAKFNGESSCWGENARGQLGDNTVISKSEPSPIIGGATFGLIEAGFAHTCGLSMSATPMCWGANDKGQLSETTTLDRQVPIFLSAPAQTSFSQVAPGAQHTCLLAPGKGVYCAGANDLGQLGTNDTIAHKTLTKISAAATFRAITSGESFSCAITLEGDALCWGDGSKGQLGAGTSDVTRQPTPVTGWR